MIKFFRKIRQNLLTENKPASPAGRFSKYLLYAIGEIALIMIGILMALQVNNWKDAKSSKISEQKILSEIRNGLWRDLSDFEVNVTSNNTAISGSEILIQYVNNKKVSLDSLDYYYTYLFRDFAPIINKSGYESLKSNGLKTISNDSLRFQIIELYDYYYTIIENNTSTQAEDLAFTNYSRLLSKLFPYMEFDARGKIISAISPSLSDLDRKELLSYLNLVINRRHYVIRRYKKVMENMKTLSARIDKELGQFTLPKQLEAYLGTYHRLNNENLPEGPTLTFSVDNNYLMTYNSNQKTNRSYYMIAKDEFESLILLNDSGDKLSMKFKRDEVNQISGVTLVLPNRSISFKKESSQ